MSLLKVYVCFFILIYGAMRPFRLAPEFCFDNFKRTYRFLSGFFLCFQYLFYCCSHINGAELVG